MRRVHIPSSSGRDIIGALHAAQFPLAGLSRNPISIVEGFATVEQGVPSPVCHRRCIGCSADAVHPSDTSVPVVSLTPELFAAILAWAGHLARSGYRILSTSRFNLFAGSNELDHPHCIDLRELLSEYFLAWHGVRLGAISSDLRFHVSSTRRFKRNLAAILDRPHLFDNICISIDEQFPFKDKRAYENYLEALDWTWTALRPTLCCEIQHEDGERMGSPRLIINLLLPSQGNAYRPQYSRLYPGGPPRATTYTDLLDRYVTPFLGELSGCSDPVPPTHLFTTEIGTFNKLPGSRFFMSIATFEPVGRAPSILEVRETIEEQRWFAPCVRTAIYPYDASSFVVRGHLAPYPSSDARLPFALRSEPPWISQLHEVLIDLSEYRA